MTLHQARAFGITVDHDHPTTVVALDGELDVEGVPRLRSVVEGLVAADHRDLVIDLRELTFCDSTGLGAFVGFHNLLDAAGGRLALREPCATVLRLFEITALDRALNLTA